MLTPIHGTCDEAFHAVRDAFQNNFVEHGEIGASVHITVDGISVVDLWSGYADPLKTSLWQEDQLVTPSPSARASRLSRPLSVLLSDSLHMKHVWRHYGPSLQYTEKNP